MADYPFTSALVTGASSGIGAEMARLLGEAGVPTVVVARRGDRLRELADRFDGFEVLEADLSKRKGQRTVAARAGSRDEPVDLVVNNAGFGSSGQFRELDRARLLNEVDVNVRALTAISHAAGTAMAARERGYLLNVSSVAGFQASPGLAVYAATKAYVTSLTEALHEELRDHGVHVTALCPGLTPTEFQDRSSTTNLVDRLPGFVWTSAASVAETALADVVRNKAISVPGALYKGMAFASSVTPRGITRRMAGMTNDGPFRNA